MLVLIEPCNIALPLEINFQKKITKVGTNELSIDAYRKAYRKVSYEQDKKGFLWHLLLYILVNIGLTILNLMSAPGYYWFWIQ